jgi:uncharacterized membrane protein YfcA
MINEIIFLILAFVVSIISATFGFGSAIILIPFSSFLLPIKKAIAIVTIFFIAGNLSKIIIFRKHIDWKTTFLIWVGAVPMVFIGAYLMVIAPSEIIKKVLGIIILLYVINDYFNLTKHIKLNKIAIAGAGGAYGFFAGIIGTGSAIKAALLTHLGLRKERFIAVMATSAILLNIIKTVIYSKFALISHTDIPLIIGLILCAFGGAYVGRNLVKKINPDTFKKIILIILVIVSIKLLFF